MPGLEISDILFSYGRGAYENRILDSVSFQIERGKICILLGANGAGKSTLLKCMNGLIHPKRGTVVWEGENIASWSLNKKAKLFGYVPQSISASSGLSVMETVLSGRLPYMRAKASSEDIDQVSQVLEKFGLSAFAFRDLRALSGGERQRVLFARAIVQRPQILLLDEPTSNLDLRYQIETMELLQTLSRKNGITVAAVIHDLNNALDYADQIVVMKHGRILSSGKPDEALSSDIIEDAYGIRADVVTVQKRKIVLVKRDEQNPLDFTAAQR